MLQNKPTIQETEKANNDDEKLAASSGENEQQMELESNAIPPAKSDLEETLVTLPPLAAKKREALCKLKLYHVLWKNDS